MGCRREGGSPSWRESTSNRLSVPKNTENSFPQGSWARQALKDPCLFLPKAFGFLSFYCYYYYYFDFFLLREIRPRENHRIGLWVCPCSVLGHRGGCEHQWKMWFRVRAEPRNAESTLHAHSGFSESPWICSIWPGPLWHGPPACEAQAPGCWSEPTVPFRELTCSGRLPPRFQKRGAGLWAHVRIHMWA